MQRNLHLGAACVFSLLGASAVAAPFTFDDIDFWVGSGPNRAAVVIDWVEDAANPPALTWGYRWDGTATGADMLTAILAADDRLFAKLGGSSANPVAVYGLGYDADADGEFALDDGTAFDENGIAQSGPADGAVSSDAADYYAEGWFLGYWHYGTAATNPYDGGAWSDSQVGMAGRALIDGAWDSWAFEDFSVTPTGPAYAEGPASAASPYPPGDFNRDDQVDLADYQLWKSEFGATDEPNVDGSGNGIVDAADYTIWRDHRSDSSNGVAAIAQVPEPGTASVAWLLLWLFWQRVLWKRKAGRL